MELLQIGQRIIEGIYRIESTTTKAALERQADIDRLGYKTIGGAGIKQAARDRTTGGDGATESRAAERRDAIDTRAKVCAKGISVRIRRAQAQRQVTQRVRREGQAGGVDEVDRVVACVAVDVRPVGKADRGRSFLISANFDLFDLYARRERCAL